MDVLLIAVFMQVLAGLGALAWSKSPRLATLVGAGGAIAASLLGLVPTLRVLCGGAVAPWQMGWDASHGAFRVEVDALSAFFLVPVLALSGLAALYGGPYLFAYRHEKSLGGPWFFFNLFVAGMVMVLVARTALLFLMAWEVMSLAAYFLVTLEHEKAEARYAGWVYLIATHLGAACLFLTFLLLANPVANAANASGSSHDAGLQFDAFRGNHLDPMWAGILFVLALVGFGAKAGFVPFHVWLPEAHAAAPSHVSALMSGVMIKMGLYGLLRVLTFLGPPQAWWGPTLAVLGLLTALIGICLALQQRDIKRVLAYSSIENMGLIGLALGVGLTGLARNELGVAVLGITAALLHVWNHALMKGLMFFCAGSVVHAAGTRDMERLGGLLKRMPWTGGVMLLGAVALAALPPLNGFAGKWLMYLSLMRTGVASADVHGLTALLAVGLLALIGGLAALTFLRLIGIVLLGTPRSDAAGQAHEASPGMIGPMLVLAALCVGVAVAPVLIADLFLGVADQIYGWEPGRALRELDDADTPLEIVGNVNGWLLFVLGASALAVMAWLRKSVPATGPTWGCGYARPTARMQYTGRSFAHIIAESLLPRFLRPRTSRQPPQGLFPARSGFAAENPDPASERVYVPLFRRLADSLTRLRVLQQGKVNVYLIYVFLTVVLALAWMTVRRWWAVS
jgi:formate hydrogenlyase subunit 3/multisubunit Na+/H+ antiporter MnhD subunit